MYIVVVHDTDIVHNNFTHKDGEFFLILVFQNWIRDFFPLQVKI